MTIKRWIASVFFVFSGWISLLIGVTYFTDAAPGAMALFPDNRFVSRLPPNTAIMDIGKFWITVTSDEVALGKKLYEAGAFVVLPAGLTGCFPRPPS